MTKDKSNMMKDKSDMMKNKSDIVINKIQSQIESLLQDKDYVVIAIDGNSGAGKSTLAKKLGKIYDCNVFHMDHFFLTRELRTQTRLKEIGGNIDYIRFYEDVLKSIKRRQDFEYRVYNCQKYSFDQTVAVKPKRINIIEGVYSMHPTLIDVYDLKVFLSISGKEQSRRILERSGSEMHEKFINLWIPLEDQYFNEMQIKQQSDLCFDML